MHSHIILLCVKTVQRQISGGRKLENFLAGILFPQGTCSLHIAHEERIF
jgi:hypothetical protein